MSPSVYAFQRSIKSEMKSPSKMDSRTEMRKVEARLGFNFNAGLSKDGRAKRTPEVRQLLAHIESINQQFYHLDWSGIRNSEGVRKAAEKTLNELGPVLWPDFDQINGPFPTWLLRPDRRNVIDSGLNNFYRRDLFFSRHTDHQILSKHFYALISLKLLHYHQNHFHNTPLRKASAPAEDLADSDSAIESESDVESSFDRESDEDYCPSVAPSRRRSGTTPLQVGIHARTGGATPQPGIKPAQQRAQFMGNTQAKLGGLDTHTRQSSNTSTSLPTLITILKVDPKALEIRGGSKATTPTTAPNAREMSFVTNLQNDPPLNVAQPRPPQNGTGKRKAGKNGSRATLKKSKPARKQPSRQRKVGHVQVDQQTAPMPNGHVQESNDQPETAQTPEGWTGSRASGGFANALKEPVIIPSRDLQQVEADDLTASRTIESANVDHEVSEQSVIAPLQTAQQNRAKHLDTNTTKERDDAEQASPPEKVFALDPPTAPKDSMSSVFLNLYLDETAAANDPLGCITLAGLSTKGELFDEVEAILGDEIGADDTIYMIRIRRADGNIFPGPNILSLAISRGGKQDMWSTLVQMVREHGTGDGCLSGFVKVRKGAGQ